MMRAGRSFFGSTAPKVYCDGMMRTRAPAETLAMLEPVVGRFGITRLANVTGLDRIGIPVYQAVRPNSRSLSVAQGKGLDATAAKVSALMESLESYHAEHARCGVRLETYRELSRQASVADPTRLPLSRTSKFHPDATLPWVEGREIVRGEAMFVPFELVHANYTVPRVPGSGAFAPSTSGLGSGNHIAEAALQGICELIERDAETLWRLGGERVLAETRVVPESITFAPARRLLERYQDAGIDVMIWDMTSDVGVACFIAIIFDTESDADLNPCPAANGSGCHPDRGIALCRALIEAAQSRLTSIAGSRDDITIGNYRRFQSAENIEYHRKLTRSPVSRAFEESPNTSEATIDDDIQCVLSSLAQRGMNEAIVVDLSTPDLDMAFVRTIVPGLEGSIESPSYLPRARALARFK